MLERATSLRVDSLSSLLSNVKLDSSPALCTLAYRILSCNYLHTLHSTNWQLQVRGGNTGLAIWKGLDKLPEVEEKKSEGRTVRWRNQVGVGRKELLKEVNTLLEVGALSILILILTNALHHLNLKRLHNLLSKGEQWSERCCS